MNSLNMCQSCGMKINIGKYCQYCVNEKGELQTFDERLEKMITWCREEDPNIPYDSAKLRTLEYMRTMPAWKNHPRIL